MRLIQLFIFTALLSVNCFAVPDAPKLTIAILATGFGDLSHAQLPPQFKVVADYGRKETQSMAEDDYGLQVAELYRKVLSPDSTIYLMNANGNINLEDAVSYAVGRVDFIVSALSLPADVQPFLALVRAAKEKNTPWIHQFRRGRDILVSAQDANTKDKNPGTSKAGPDFKVLGAPDSGSAAGYVAGVLASLKAQTKAVQKPATPPTKTDR